MFTSTKLYDLPLEFKDILNEHMEIIASDSCSEFPPMRSIYHHMDFIVIDILPNNVSYRLTPIENEEIRIQVDEPLKKGLIRDDLVIVLFP